MTENSLILSYSPSTGNISVVKEIVDKLLKGYDVRLRPDFGGMVTTGGGEQSMEAIAHLYCWLGRLQHALTL